MCSGVCRFAGGTETPVTFKSNRRSRRQSRPVRGQLREEWPTSKNQVCVGTRQTAVAREGGVFAPDGSPRPSGKDARMVNGGKSSVRAWRQLSHGCVCRDAARTVIGLCTVPACPRPASRPPFVVRSHGAGAPPGHGRRPVEWEAVRERPLDGRPAAGACRGRRIGPPSSAARTIFCTAIL